MRGENVYPSEIDAALNAMPDYGGEHRIIITRETAMDEIAVQVEAAQSVHEAGSEAVAQFRDRVFNELHRLLGIRANVEVVAEQTIPRTDFKARRVIDDRRCSAPSPRTLEAAHDGSPIDDAGRGCAGGQTVGHRPADLPRGDRRGRGARGAR